MQFKRVGSWAPWAYVGQVGWREDLAPTSPGKYVRLVLDLWVAEGVPRGVSK